MREEIMTSKEETIAEMKVWHEEIKAPQEPGKTKIKSGQEDVMATDLEAIPEEVEIITEHQKVPKEEATVEAAAAWEGQWEDQQPAMVCRNPRKRQTRGNFAKGAPEGPPVEKRQWMGLKCNTGIKDQGTRWQLCLGKETTSGRSSGRL